MFLLSSRGSPFGLSCFPLVFSSFSFYKSVWNTLLSSLNSLEERYHGAFVIFNQNKSPGSYPAHMKEGLKLNPSGWEEEIVQLSPQVTVYISPRYVSASGTKGNSTRVVVLLIFSV